jgi:hypothetical protein
MMKLKVGQEVLFREECWAKNQKGVITEVFETNWEVDGEHTKYGYIVKIITQTNRCQSNFYDFELRLSKKEERKVKINQILS